MITYRIQQQNQSERGGALAMIILSVAGLAALSAAMMTVGLSSAREQSAESLESQAEYICQAGLSQSVYLMRRGLDANVGSPTHQQSWGGGRFWVTAVPAGPNLTRLTANGVENGTGKSQELVVKSIPTNMWTNALFGKDSINLDDSVRVDSYNSAVGTYASQLVGSGLTAHALAHGTVGSNGDIGVHPASWIWGDAVAGPGHSVTLTGGSVSGSTISATSQVSFPPINVPTYTNYGSVTFNTNSTIPTGDRTYTNLTVRSNKALTIVGPAHIVMNNLTMRSNASILIDDTAGPVTLTVIDNFVLEQNSTMRPLSNNPASLRINMLSDNVADPEVTVQLDTVTIASNSAIYGCVYAPEARIMLSSNFSLYGALMSRSLDLNSNCNFHYDEHLMQSMSDGTYTYEMVSWRSIPFRD
jgi:hypothetical protein